MSSADFKPIEPRLVNKATLAAFLGYSPRGFANKLPALQEKGFPSKLETLDRFDLAAVNRWLDSLGERQAARDGAITGALARHGRSSAFNRK